MNERINELADLFAKRAELDKSIEELINGEVEVGSDEEGEESEGTPRKARKKRKAGTYSKSNPMPESVKEEIHLKASQGQKASALAKEYGISVATVFKVLKTKPTSHTTKNNLVQSYVCIHGHEFTSKLLPGDVMCPTCHSDDCDLGTLNGAVAEDEI